MAFTPMMELIGVHNHYWLKPPIPTGAEGGDDVFWLMCVVSGMKEGAFRLPDGKAVFAAKPGKICGSAMILLPPGSRADASFKKNETEAFSYFFRCSGLEYDAARARTLLHLPNGNLQRMQTVKPLGSHEVVTMRTLFENVVTTFWKGSEAGAMVRAQLLFHGLFAQMFAIPFAREEYEYTVEKKLEKMIERDGHSVKLHQMAAETGHSLRWVRERFRREYGVNPSEIKAHQTLHLARWYIEKTKLPFKRVAERLGFSSPNYFTHFVRHHLGAPPRILRRKATSAMG